MFAFTPQGQKLSMVLLRLTRLYTSRLGPITQKYDLTVDQFFVLLRLADAQNPISISELSEHAFVQQPAVTKMMPKFLQRNLVSALKPNQDRRKTMVAITGEGRALLGEIQNRITRNMLPFLMAVPYDVQVEFLKHSEHLIAKIESSGNL